MKIEKKNSVLSFLCELIIWNRVLHYIIKIYQVLTNDNDWYI